jgi:hypothetical protein
MAGLPHALGPGRQPALTGSGGTPLRFDECTEADTRPMAVMPILVDFSVGAAAQKRPALGLMGGCRLAEHGCFSLHLLLGSALLHGVASSGQ